MSEVGTLLAVAVGSGGLGWVGSMITEFLKSRGQSRSLDREADIRLEAHRDELTFQLLEAARTEVVELRKEIQRLRPMESHLLHFDEALMHVERLLVVPTESGNRVQIEREARAFLNRVGQVRQSEQVLRSAEADVGRIGGS
jgi:hypothetical protein